MMFWRGRKAPRRAKQGRAARGRTPARCWRRSRRSAGGARLHRDRHAAVATPIVGRRACDRHVSESTGRGRRRSIRRARRDRGRSATICGRLRGARLSGLHRAAGAWADRGLSPRGPDRVHEARRSGSITRPPRPQSIGPACRSTSAVAICASSGRASSRRSSGASAASRSAAAAGSRKYAAGGSRPIEDKLDAVVCAAVAIAALNGEADAHGDDDGAIWVPRARPAAKSEAGGHDRRAAISLRTSGRRRRTRRRRSLAERPGAVVERIVSTGQASPEGFWYDQDWTEWVVVLAGEAGLRDRGRGGTENAAARATGWSCRRASGIGSTGPRPTGRRCGWPCTGKAENALETRSIGRPKGRPSLDGLWTASPRSNRASVRTPVFRRAMERGYSRPRL